LSKVWKYFLAAAGAILGIVAAISGVSYVRRRIKDNRDAIRLSNAIVEKIDEVQGECNDRNNEIENIGNSDELRDALRSAVDDGLRDDQQHS
jgi:hypothetical protein